MLKINTHVANKKGFFSVMVALLAIFILVLVVKMQAFDYKGYSPNDELRYTALKAEEGYYSLDTKVNEYLQSYTLPQNCNTIEFIQPTTSASLLPVGCRYENFVFSPLSYTSSATLSPSATLICDFGAVNYSKNFVFKHQLIINKQNICNCTIKIMDSDSGIEVHSGSLNSEDIDDDDYCNVQDPDDDGDGRPDEVDNCSSTPNPPAQDPDNDCVFPGDNCPNNFNPYQENSDSDTYGDACDAYPTDPTRH